MVRQVRLFLIRHGETVDNVAQVTAGSRDSELTNHGYHQATRLGQHFRSHGVTFTHIFSSHLQRAVKTAGKIREAQVAPSPHTDTVITAPDVVQLALIMEQDFGFFEGRKWGEADRPDHHNDMPGFVAVETRKSMTRRVDAFLDAHLFPIFGAPTETGHVVAVVSHGRILSMLWKRLLARLPPKSVTFSDELTTNPRKVALDHLGGWANTGYLELYMQNTSKPQPHVGPLPVPSPTSQSAPSVDVLGQAEVDKGTPVDSPDRSPSKEVDNVNSLDAATRPLRSASLDLPLLHGWLTTVETVNGRDHLKGLIRTGGGVGSARHDTSQKTLDGFVKKRIIG
jgi:broad specificity phosphatase PhoE